MRLPDSDRSRVVLIGTGSHTIDSTLPDLPAVVNNVTDLAAVLADREFGWLRPNAQNVILNPRSTQELGVTISRLAGQAEDLLLIYFAGHGLVDMRGNLYLALSGTQQDYLTFTAFPYEGLRDAIASSPASNRVVILDCCFSGLAVDAMSDPGSVLGHQLAIAGSYTLTATTATALALAPRGARNTAFTGDLVTLLRDGSTGAPDLLTLEQIYLHVDRAALSAGRPRPQQRGTNTAAHLALARNRAHIRPAPAAPNWTHEQVELLVGASREIGTTLDTAHTAQELVNAATGAFPAARGFADYASVSLLAPVLRGEAPSAMFTGHSAELILIAEAAPKVISGRDRRPEYLGDIRLDHNSLLATTLRGTQPRLLHQSAGPLFQAAMLALHHRGSPRPAGAHSYLAVPLVARGIVLGVAEFARGLNAAPFGEADVELAAELAARTAVCLDNARLVQRERYVAVSLQRSLLPTRLPATPDLDVASRYLPSDSGGVVGGDWFDVINLARNKVALVIGDVMGKGIAAAASMGQFRTAARALLELGLAPADVLTHLDRITATMGEEFVATCVCVIYDPAGHQCVAASAGHLPPVIASPDGTTTIVDLPIGIPLGVGGVPFTSSTFDLPADALLALYTNGLVEGLDRDIVAGIKLLAKSLALHHANLEYACDQVLSAVLTNQWWDDVALLIAKVRPAAD